MLEKIRYQGSSHWQNLRLFRPLVNLSQEITKDAPFQSLTFVHIRNHGPELCDSLLFVCLVPLLQLQLLENGFTLRLLFLVLLAVIGIEDFALFGRAYLQSLVDDPAAFVVLNVRSDLANGFWRAKASR